MKLRQRILHLQPLSNIWTTTRRGSARDGAEAVNSAFATTIKHMEEGVQGGEEPIFSPMLRRRILHLQPPSNIWTTSRRGIATGEEPIFSPMQRQRILHLQPLSNIWKRECKGGKSLFFHRC